MAPPAKSSWQQANEEQRAFQERERDRVRELNRRANIAPVFQTFTREDWEERDVALSEGIAHYRDDDASIDPNPVATENFIFDLPFNQPVAQNKTLARMLQMLREERDIMLAKNSDYANSDVDPLKNFRMIEMAGTPAFDGALARMSDKFIRVMNLRQKQKSGGTVGVPSESLADTLLDLSNYARICRLLLEEEEA